MGEQPMKSNRLRATYAISAATTGAFLRLRAAVAVTGSRGPATRR